MNKHKWRRELVQWSLAVMMVLGGIVIWRLTFAHQVHAQEAQPDPAPQVEGCPGGN